MLNNKREFAEIILTLQIGQVKQKEQQQHEPLKFHQVAESSVSLIYMVFSLSFIGQGLIKLLCYIIDPVKKLTSVIESGWVRALAQF